MAATSGRGSTAPLAYAAMVASRPGEPDKMPTAVTSLRARVRVSMRLGCRPARCRPPARRAPPGRGPERAGARRWRRRPPRRRAGPGGCPRSRRARSRGCGRRRATPAATHQVHLGAGSAGEHRDQQADGSRAEHQRPVPGREVRGLRRTQSVAAGLDQRAEHGVDGVGQRVQRGGRHGQLLGQGAGTVRRGCRPRTGSRRRAGAPAGTGGRCRRRAWCRP